MVTIDNTSYYEVEEFATLINRKPQTVRWLITHGNKIRKLKSRKIGRSILIPKSEYTGYPFTVQGANNQTVYFFNEDGTKRYLTEAKFLIELEQREKLSNALRGVKNDWSN